MNRNFRIAIITLSSLFVITLIGLYIGRNALLQSYVDKKIERIERTQHLLINYDKLRLLSLQEVEVQNFTLVPEGQDTLFTLRSLKLKFKLASLLRMNLDIQNVEANDIALSFVKQDSLSNYDFLFRKHDEPMTIVAETDYAHRIKEVLELFFNYLPQNGDIHRVTLSHRRDSVMTEINIPALNIREGHFHSLIGVKEQHKQSKWMFDGIINDEQNILELKMYAPQAKVELPYIHTYYGAQVAFDTLSFCLTENLENSSQLSLTGRADVIGLTVYHQALSPEAIDLDCGKLNYCFHVGKNYIEMDSATTIQFNQLRFHPYARATKEKEWHLVSSINQPFFPAKHLFSSLPKGLFNNLEGMEVSGELAYHCLIDLDFNQLDSLRLESEMKQKNFAIVRYGATNLSKMSSEFLYTAYEHGQPVRSFTIGPSNPNFLPLDSISPLLQMSILQSEDGAFFYHQGFLIDAMREALIHDLKVKRFARGGSTITMQLVKNVFLTRNKNIARKLEEALIVWLIESKHLTSKARMYEVYLNIAEWGPLIYGAKEAAEYYFDKKPSQLTANEAIFLASIIPKPKHFRNSFDADMQLRNNLDGYYHLIAHRLQVKGLITEEEADSMRAQIEVGGQAKEDLNVTKEDLSPAKP
ncbi:MAG: biosynthetic peptidoglycan transglycosylase [Bacteroides sp.]